MSDTLNSEIIKSYISVPFSHPILVYSTTDSTNTEALKHAFDNNAMYSVIVSDTQTNGKGRQGKSFYSPGETGIYLSMLLPRDNIHILQITPAIAVAVCRTIEEVCNVHAEIKWINDIFYNAKKICGILVEGFTNFETGTIESAIVGIGINILQDAKMPDEIAKIAGGIVNGISISNVSRGEIAAEVACQVLKIYEEDFSEVLKEYKALNFLIGQTVQVFPVIGDESKAYSALVKDIDENAALIVQTDNGELKHLNSGEVSLKSSHISTQYFPLSANIANI